MEWNPIRRPGSSRGGGSSVGRRRFQATCARAGPRPFTPLPGARHVARRVHADPGRSFHLQAAAPLARTTRRGGWARGRCPPHGEAGGRGVGTCRRPVPSHRAGRRRPGPEIHPPPGRDPRPPPPFRCGVQADTRRSAGEGRAHPRGGSRSKPGSRSRSRRTMLPGPPGPRPSWGAARPGSRRGRRGHAGSASTAGGLQRPACSPGVEFPGSIVDTCRGTEEASMEEAARWVLLRRNIA